MTWIATCLHGITICLHQNVMIILYCTPQLLMQHAGSSEQLDISAKTKRQLNLEGILDDEKHAELSQIFRNISIEGVYIQGV